VGGGEEKLGGLFGSSGTVGRRDGDRDVLVRAGEGRAAPALVAEAGEEAAHPRGDARVSAGGPEAERVAQDLVHRERALPLAVETTLARELRMECGSESRNERGRGATTGVVSMKRLHMLEVDLPFGHSGAGGRGRVLPRPGEKGRVVPKSG